MAAIKFSKSKYVSPNELMKFSSLLEQTIAQIEKKKTLNITQDYKESYPIFIEAWQLVHHITCGEYLIYKSTILQKDIKLWIGLDLVEEGIALIIWFEKPNQKIITNLINISNKAGGEFGRYKQGKIDQVWIALKDKTFNQFHENPTSQIIEDFLKEVLKDI
jgi:hypothetical protein